MGNPVNPNTGLEVGVGVETDFTIPVVDETLVGKTEAELKVALEAKIKSESETLPVQPAPVTLAPEVPVQEPLVTLEAPVVAPPGQPKAEIPVKFQKPDGSLDEEKLAKSRVAVDEYVAAEKELTRLRQEHAQGAPLSAEQETALRSSFRERVNKDFEDNPALALEKLSNSIQAGMSMDFERKLNALRSQIEMKGMAERHPEILTKEKLAALKQIRTERPHLSWEDAIEIDRGRQAGVTGSPIAQVTPKAPILPGGIGTLPPTTTSSAPPTLDKVLKLLEGKSSMEQEKLLESLLPHK